jgi:hypothetical protein
MGLWGMERKSLDILGRRTSEEKGKVERRNEGMGTLAPLSDPFPICRSAQKDSLSAMSSVVFHP